MPNELERQLQCTKVSTLGAEGKYHSSAPYVFFTNRVCNEKKGIMAINEGNNNGDVCTRVMIMMITMNVMMMIITMNTMIMIIKIMILI